MQEAIACRHVARQLTFPRPPEGDGTVALPRPFNGILVKGLVAQGRLRSSTRTTSAPSHFSGKMPCPAQCCRHPVNTAKTLSIRPQRSLQVHPVQTEYAMQCHMHVRASTCAPITELSRNRRGRSARLAALAGLIAPPMVVRLLQIIAGAGGRRRRGCRAEG